jgi:hypothetical protein
LEIFQEDCTGRPPWGRQDNTKEAGSQNKQHYNNIPYYHNVDIGNSFTTGKHIPGQWNFTSLCTRQDDKINRSHETYFNKQNNTKEQDAYVTNIPSKINNRTEITDMYSARHRDGIYGNEPAYSHRNNSVFEQSNTSTTDNGKNNCKVQHNLSHNISHEERSDIHNNSDTYKQVKRYSVFPSEENTMNNWGAQMYKFNLVHENNSFADESNVASADTEHYLSNYMTWQVRRNNNYNIFRAITNTSSVSDKGASENITKYCNDINSDEGKPNVSSFSIVRNYDLTSIPNDVVGNSKFTLHRNKSAHTTTGQRNGLALNGKETATDSGLTQEVTTRERRNVVYSQYRTDRLWSSGENTCGIWGLGQWLLRVKQYFWKKIPQLLCPLLPPLTGQRCQVFSQTRGWIQSPGHPLAYPNNLRLCYR